MFCKNWWWRGQDNVTGSSRSEWLFGNWRDNTIDGAGGNDVIFSRWGNDVVSGGDGNDWIWSGHGNDTVNGDAGRDFVFGGSGRDVVDGGAGSDKVYGGRGDDEAIYTVSENQGAKDYYNGGSGNDLLVLRMTHAEYEAAKSELDAFDQYLSERACGWKYKAFHFQSFDLTVRDFERFEVELTDEPPADPNVAPEANADSVASTVDGLAIQDAEANDPDGQPLSETAQVIERSSFRVAKGTDVGDDTLPRVSIKGAIGASVLNAASAGTNDVDVYAIELMAHEKLILDIDYGYEMGSDPLVTWLFLLDENGNEIANVERLPDTGGTGSTSFFDPYMEFTNGDSAATYYVAVSSFGNSPDPASGKFNDGGMLTGDYVLNVSISNAQSDIGALVIAPDTLLANDVDANGDPLEILSVGNAKNGEVKLTGNGKILFKPASDSPGSFDYTVSDGNGAESTATVTVNGNAVLGTPSDDVLEGTPQSDMFTGGAGNDTFNFSSDSGADTISDFELGADAIAFTDGTSIAGTQSIGNDTLVEFDSGGSVLLVGVTGVTDVNDLLG